MLRLQLALIKVSYRTIRHVSAKRPRNFAELRSLQPRLRPTGTTSAMTLVGVQFFGRIDGNAASNRHHRRLSGRRPGAAATSLITSETGVLSVSYILEFASDALPSEPHKYLAIIGFAKSCVMATTTAMATSIIPTTPFGARQWDRPTPPPTATVMASWMPADYIMWRNNFTGPIGAGASTAAGLTASQAIPEPSARAVRCDRSRLRRSVVSPASLLAEFARNSTARVEASPP